MGVIKSTGGDACAWRIDLLSSMVPTSLSAEAFSRERVSMSSLPQYSLGEDYDLWVRVKRYGLTGRYDRCVAVHLRASGGRLTARTMAYSHIANHWHFLRKGVSSLPYPWNYARFLALCIKLPLLSLIEMRGARVKGRTPGLFTGNRRYPHRALIPLADF